MVKNKRIMKDPIQDKILYFVVGLFFTIFTILVLYPIIYVISASFSSGTAVSAGRVVLWPVEPGLQGYKAVFSHKYVITGYRNTIFYTIVGTLLSVSVTLMAAYPLTRKDFPARKFCTIICTFTMFFSGGLIPTYILIVQLKFINTIWAILIPGALSVYNMILVRTYIISSIPNELLEASKIDGCNDTQYFLKIVLPLSKPVIAVITLYSAVGRWNSYFSALLYLNNRNLFPLQLILREILIISRVDLSDIQDAELLATMIGLENLLKFSLIVVSSVPIILVYPFIQRYFIKGVMIGSLKG